ncbi:hypothetical protein EO98_13380 [Methanosarcina sp. 2.H.T.1A.6]|uniref:hypothetical protein n=1 Tax=unclassified Methanosarcina TaxID=2644672 RepID=UPI000621E771|nr:MULTISPECIES: hypothetical protein [unclassified Methanosarcina]KKG14430.1 hypothetical protein EO94_15180 [Methanosarcina sp. 2.H.T.1A.3]KKG16583.1 hypothetical protein EO97_10385 [Methanosarcina sp. 2.H.T.1A.15]KKG21822.1 hypothetical protein EO96_16775 [Methanosarcina sp. 2.H.T.1A.8]KKG24196.1 hypothetical protein EO98_13380 [Methanosarcina sp. 2.H.T.1A.6]
MDLSIDYVQKYPKTNALKLRMMFAVFRDPDGTITCREIADTPGIPAGNVSRLMRNYRKKECGYSRRLKPDKSTKAYKYRLTKKGALYLVKYAKRAYYCLENLVLCPRN